MVHECGRPTDQLNIGDVIAVGAEKSPDIATDGGEGATAALLPAGHVFRGGQVQQICRVFRRPDDGGHGVVVEVGSDAGQVDLDRDVVCAQLLGWTDARQHQQLRGINRSCA